MDDVNIKCRVHTDALQDIDQSKRMDEPLSQFEANQSSFQNIAEKLIRNGRVQNGQLVISKDDIHA